MSSDGWNAEKVRRAKIHAGYISFFVFVTFIFIATKKWSIIPSLVDKVNFAASMTSLLLAILAIVYAVWSNSSTSGSISSLIGVANGVDKAASDLASASQQLTEDIRLLNLSTMRLGERLENHDVVIKTALSINNSSQGSKEKSKVSLDDIKTFLSNSSALGLFSLVSASVSEKLNAEISISDVMEGVELTAIDYMAGYLVASSVAGYIEEVKLIDWTSKVYAKGCRFTVEDIYNSIEQFIGSKKLEGDEIMSKAILDDYEKIKENVSKMTSR